jgi:ribosomal protein L18
MKTTKRSKMLLSSIAMLLVALVALGSATFAWYFTNAQVTANGTTAKAAASSGLVIRKTTSDTWAQAITYTSNGTDRSLSPSAWDTDQTTTANWNGEVAAAGTSVSDGTRATAGTAVAATALTDPNEFGDIIDYVAYDDFYVATPGAATNATMQIKGSTVAGTYINVLVFVDDTLVASATSTPSKTSTTGRKSTGVASTNALTFTGLGTNSSSFQVATNAGSANGSHVEVIAYPDGENSLCTTNTASVTAFPVTYQFDQVTS